MSFNFTRKTDGDDTVYSSDVNELQEAIEQTKLNSDFGASAGPVAGVAYPMVSSPRRISPFTDYYRSWPVIARTALGTLVVAYARGAAHTQVDTTRGIYVQRSTDDGRTWGDPIEVVNEGSTDQSTYGMGLDNAGRLLLWCRNSGGFTHDLYRSTDDGLTWALLVTPSFAVDPVLIGPPVALGSNKLIACYHAASESGESGRKWGVVRSADDGATWTQEQFGDEASDTAFPVEGRIARHGDGRLIMICRQMTDGEPLHQLTSDDDGATWTAVADTNIEDCYGSPVGMTIYEDVLSLWYFDRDRAVLRARHTLFDDVYDDPLAWLDSTPIGYGFPANYLDGGYVHAVADGSRAYIVYYAGVPRYPNIYVVAADWNPRAISSNVRPIPRIEVLSEVHPQCGLTFNSDSTYSVASTAGTGSLIGGAFLPIMDDWFVQGQLYWRIMGYVQADTAQTLDLMFGFSSGAGGTAIAATSIQTASTSMVAVDTGWIALPTNFGQPNATYQALRNLVQLRARVSGGTGKVHTLSRLLIGLER